jgi:hypothetical protein
MTTQQSTLVPCVELEQNLEQEQEEIVSCHGSAKIYDKKINDNFEFPIDMDDVLFTLTLNPSIYKENIKNLISKMVVINELNYVNLLKLSQILGYMGIKEVAIFSIDDNIETMSVIRKDNGSIISYTELKREQFITILNSKANFSDYNRYSLYILRNGGFLDIKNLFAYINGYQTNIGRGGSQKAHVLSPLDLRLSSYMMAMFNFDYKLLSTLNEFNVLNKDRYLSYLDKTPKVNNKSLKPCEKKNIYKLYR